MPDLSKRAARLAAGLAGLAVLTACHTDPFSVKPEVNVTLPDRAPAEPAPAETVPDDAGKADEADPAGDV